MLSDLILSKNNFYTVTALYSNIPYISLNPYNIKNKNGEYLLPIVTRIENIEPVSITEDILKMNGLNDCGTFYDGWNFDLTDNKKNAVSVGGIWFVHELQHALRLCGLNELADNFKIE